MSRTEIPADLYYKLLTDSIAYWIGQGMDLTAARNMAQNQMSNAFVTDDATLSTELEKDYAEKGVYR